MYYILCFLLFVNSSFAIDKALKRKHLNTIAFIESTNGKNINHKPVFNSTHNGDSAIGKYGLMPNTIKLILKKDKKLNKKYAFLANLNGYQIRKYFNQNRIVEEEFASALYDYYASKYDQRIEYISCAWHYGEGKVVKTDDNIILHLPYVKRVIALYAGEN